MRFERAVRFGFVGSIGVIAISLGTYWMLQLSESPANPFGEAFIFLIVVGLGLAVALTFLFGLIDVFVDEKLEVHDSSSTGE